MKRNVVPSLIANSQKELNQIFAKVKNHSKTFQVDVMDGKFVKNKSLMFNFKLPKRGLNYEAHLMVKNPRNWIKNNHKKVDTIIFHIETCKNENGVKELIKLVKLKRKKFGIAINPRTKVEKIKAFLVSINMVLVMTVNPGKYGAKFLPYTLKKIKELRKLKPRLNIEVDGGINDKTISLAKKSGANSFVVGSYLQKSKDVKKAIEKLNKNS